MIIVNDLIVIDRGSINPEMFIPVRARPSEKRRI
jgi:hypothetical protein